MNIWALTKGEDYILPLTAQPWRVVEAQHVLSARDLVDTTDEHDVLEELLELSKPSIQCNKNYLLFTPFRYPPLKYGSRFGQIHELSLWYGSLEVRTAFAEVAYYQLKFHADTSADLGTIDILLTAFNAYVKTDRGVDLTQHPFAAYREYISSQHSYEYSQCLGMLMREAAVEAFLYTSARSGLSGINMGVFTPEIFVEKNHQYLGAQQTWTCLATAQWVEFNRVGWKEKQRFYFQDTFFNANSQ